MSQGALVTHLQPLDMTSVMLMKSVYCSILNFCTVSLTIAEIWQHGPVCDWFGVNIWELISTFVRIKYYWFGALIQRNRIPHLPEIFERFTILSKLWTIDWSLRAMDPLTKLKTAKFYGPDLLVSVNKPHHVNFQLSRSGPFHDSEVQSCTTSGNVSEDK